MPRYLIGDLIGRQFDGLKVVGSPTLRSNQKLWPCICSCGNFTEVSGSNLLKGTVKSCGCRKYIKPYQSLYNYCIFHAKRERPELLHTLSYEEFLQFTKIPECHYCGAPIEFVKRNINGDRAIRYNLDRKDNSRGYTKDNLVVCCKRCNYTKGDRFTYEQFVQIGVVIKTFNVS